MRLKFMKKHRLTEGVLFLKRIKLNYDFKLLHFQNLWGWHYGFNATTT